MHYNQLSAEQQNLVNTDFGDDLEKEAAEKVALVQEMYQEGHDKIASQIADDIDELVKQAEEEEEEEDEEEDDNEKQASATAAELGAFIERGTFDGLQKLGSERQGDPMYYLWPYIEEKVAEAGKAQALKKLYNTVAGHVATGAGKVRGAASTAKGKAGEYAGKAKGKAGEYAGKAREGARGYVDETKRNLAGAYSGGIRPKGSDPKSPLRATLKGRDRVMAGAKGVGMASAPLSVAGLGAYGGSKLLSGKKDD